MLPKTATRVQRERKTLGGQMAIEDQGLQSTSAQILHQVVPLPFRRPHLVHHGGHGLAPDVLHLRHP
jgi:hypothetical protein